MTVKEALAIAADVEAGNSYRYTTREIEKAADKIAGSAHFGSASVKAPRYMRAYIILTDVLGNR